MADESKRSAAYLPWATFKNALDTLEKGMPSRIDRSVFPGIAWNVQTQLFAGMKFMGLLQGDGEDEPTPLLHDLVQGTEAERKTKLKKVIEQVYADLIAIDLTKASRAHFEEKFGEFYNVTGDTRVKAVRFFVSAAQYVGIPLSAFIAPTPGSPAKARRVGRPRGTRRPAATAPAATGATAEQTKPKGTSKSVSLASGGELTLSATLDLFSLNSEDRKFVFDLIDKLEAYAAAK